MEIPKNPQTQSAYYMTYGIERYNVPPEKLEEVRGFLLCVENVIQSYAELFKVGIPPELLMTISISSEDFSKMVVDLELF